MLALSGAHEECLLLPIPLYAGVAAEAIVLPDSVVGILDWRTLRLVARALAGAVIGTEAAGAGTDAAAFLVGIVGSDIEGSVAKRVTSSQAPCTLLAAAHKLSHQR